MATSSSYCRERAMDMRQELDRVLLKAIKLKAPKELIRRFYLVRGSIDFWLSPPIDCWTDRPDEVHLNSALAEADESLRSWQEWLQRQTVRWRAVARGNGTSGPGGGGTGANRGGNGSGDGDGDRIGGANNSGDGNGNGKGHAVSGGTGGPDGGSRHGAR